MSLTQPAPLENDRAVPAAEMVIAAEPAQVMSNRLGRAVYMALGFVSLGLGIAGYIVPLLPGTVFLLLATYFFFRSSERMYNWVVNHPRFGPLIRGYLAGYGIPRRIKIYAVGLLAVSFAATIVFAVDNAVVRVVLVAVALAVTTFILTRPTTEAVLAEG